MNAYSDNFFIKGSYSSNIHDDKDIPWYEPYIWSFEIANAIPLSISALDAEPTRGEAIEIIYRMHERYFTIILESRLD